MRLPFALAGLVFAAILAAWAWLGAAVPAPPSPLAAGEKLPCVSYAPFRPGQSPFMAGLHIPPEQIDDDFAHLAKITQCVRTYSTEMGLDVVPALARKHGLTVLQGIWLGREKDKNAIEIEHGIKAATENRDVVKALIVGNEVLLRGELSATDLAQTIRQVRETSGMPVTYADVWEFWERNRDLAKDVDFVTVHILPFWEDIPVSADKAAAHIAEIRDHVGTVFAGKDILIGETGWPSEGRMREGAEPSASNQAKVIQQLLALAKEHNYRVNVVEAFDQPWKRALEGTVGGYWGFLDAYSRDFKFGWGDAVSNHPHWLRQALAGIVFAALIFGAAVRGVDRRGLPLSCRQWGAVAFLAFASGIGIGWAFALVPVQSRDWGLWVRGIVMLLLALAVPLVTTYGIGAGARQVGLVTALEPTARRAASCVERAVAFLQVAALVLAAQITAGLVFDPRYRDFEFAGLTPILVGLAAYAFVAQPRPAGGERHADWIAGGFFALAGLFVIVNERLANWQALWTGTLLVLFGLALLRLARATTWQTK
ncbi:beta-1,6-glucan synthase [Ancylobacter sp. 6x-1]|uniref:Endo-1,3-beta-glucanase btgC n=1 Tax=Ancylobacter crimeensis TaxID=2579147 RepID=A0ABT0DCH9_9HYPH|nr:beta-1,6-glucan synthase [Ancylobacter crimeensis]MCK0197654.1 beta-1,6-glucan synthase [Ancylobacter crimeensis]